MPVRNAPLDVRPQVGLCVVILNYRTPELVVDVLKSLQGQIRMPDSIVVVVDNHSGDGSDVQMDQAISELGFGEWAMVVQAGRNGGFAAGNNVGIRAVDAEFYMLLNSDTIVRPGAVELLLREMNAHPDVGIGSPRLEWPDGTPQNSCFRDPSIATEFVGTAATGPITRLLPTGEIALPASDEPADVAWTSFACVVIRRQTVERIGLMDEGYFMYFEDADYCRIARQAGIRVRHFPVARVVHLRGGSSDVKEKMAAKKRPPKYYFEARSRYFRKHYGALGAVRANLTWTSGRCLHLAREKLTGAKPNACEREWLDIWTGAVNAHEWRK